MSSCSRVKGNSSDGGAGGAGRPVPLRGGRSAGAGAVGEVGEQDRGRRLDHHRARHHVAAAQAVLVEQGHQGEDQKPDRGEQPAPAGRLGEHRARAPGAPSPACRTPGSRIRLRANTASAVSGPPSREITRSSVRRLPTGHAAPVHLEVDEVEVPAAGSRRGPRRRAPSLAQPDQRAPAASSQASDRPEDDQQECRTGRR